MAAVPESLARASTRSVVLPVFFLRIDGEAVTAGAGVARAFSGIGRRFLPADAVETTASAPYRGCGFLNSTPELQCFFQGESQAITLQLSGVDERTVALVDQASTEISGAPAWFGYAFRDRRNQLATPVYWDFEGEVDTVDWSDQPSGDGASIRTRTVAVSLVGGFSDRRFRLLQTCSPVDQALRDPDDRAFEHVPNLEQGATADWPLK